MPDTPFSAQMLLLYSNTFLVMVQFTLVQPTAGTYAAWFTGSTKLGGTLIASSQFGSAILQIPIYFMLRHLPFKTVTATLLAFECIGSLLYALALTANQVTVLFVGRAISSFCSGQQIYLTGLTQADLARDDKRTATQINSLMYQIAAFLSLTTAGFVLSASPLRKDVPVNAATIPGVVAAALVLLLLLYTLLAVPTRVPFRFRVELKRDALGRALVGWCVIFTTSLMEGLRQVTLFELYYERWQHEWTSSTPTTASLLASFVFFGSAVSFLFDRHLAYTRRNTVGGMLVLACTMLTLAPWQCTTVASVLLQSITGVVYAIFIRIMYGHASFVVIEAAQRSRYIRVYYLVSAAVTSVGMGTGATVASAVDLSVAPFMVACALCVLCSLALAFQ